MNRNVDIIKWYHDESVEGQRRAAESTGFAQTDGRSPSPPPPSVHETYRAHRARTASWYVQSRPNIRKPTGICGYPLFKNRIKLRRRSFPVDAVDACVTPWQCGLDLKKTPLQMLPSFPYFLCPGYILLLIEYVSDVWRARSPLSERLQQLLWRDPLHSTSAVKSRRRSRHVSFPLFA